MRDGAEDVSALMAFGLIEGAGWGTVWGLSCLLGTGVFAGADRSWLQICDASSQ